MFFTATILINVFLTKTILFQKYEDKIFKFNQKKITSNIDSKYALSYKKSF
jgi:hypothetical protein